MPDRDIDLHDTMKSIRNINYVDKYMIFLLAKSLKDNGLFKILIIQCEVHNIGDCKTYDNNSTKAKRGKMEAYLL